MITKDLLVEPVYFARNQIGGDKASLADFLFDELLLLGLALEDWSLISTEAG